MDRKYNIRLDLQFRCNNSVMKFRQSDNQTSDFFMRVTAGGELFNIDNAIVILAIIKPDKSSQAQFLEVREGKIYADLNANMKDQVGTYKAQALLIYEDERVSTDVIEYEVTEDNILNQLETTVSTTEEFTMLQQMLSRLSVIENSENLRVENENNRVEAEKLREEAIEKIKSDTTKLISDTKKEIAYYKNAKDTAINEDLTKYKQDTNQAIDNYKSAKDTEINDTLNKYKTNTTDDIEEFKSAKSQELDNFKNTKNTELDNYKREKDLAINQYVESKNLEINDYVAAKNRELDEYKGAKDKEIDQYKNTKDKLINNKITEVESAKQNIISTANNKISEMDQAKTNMQNSVNAKLEEADNRISELQNFESQLEQIENKNIEQDTRLKQVEYKNKVQDVYVSGLFNENNDKRLTIEGEGNSLKLEGSKQGLVEVEKIVGDTMVNLATIRKGSFNFRPNPSVGVNIPLLRKINTVFTVIINVKNHTLNYNCKIQLNCDDNVNIYPTGISSSTTGLTVFKIQPIKEGKFHNVHTIRFYTDNTTEGNFAFDDLIILEGDYTNKPIPQYFEGMQSTFEECKVTQEMIDSGEESVENLGKYKYEVEVMGKNLLKYKFENGNMGYNGTPSTSTEPSYIRSIDYVPCKGDTDIIVTYDSSFRFSQIFFYDENKNFITRNTVVRNTTPFNTAFVKITLAIKDTSTNIDKVLLDMVNTSTMLLEYGQTTSYEPYYERTQTVYLNSPLLKGDEIVCKEDGLYHYHKMGKELFDGSIDESWVKADTNWWGIPLTNCSFSTSINTICDKLIPVSYDNRNTMNSVYCGSENLYTRVVANSLSEYKQWLQDNPIAVIYELAEPYYEKISDEQIVLEIPNNATLSVESVIPCTSISATYTGNVPSLYGMENSILEIEEHNVDMVATTFDMDYRLLEVEWALEDAGLTGISLASTFNLNRKGEKTMALSRYEQAKIMILGGAYDKATLTKQLTRYLEKNIITKEEYDELIALMEAKELVTGE